MKKRLKTVLSLLLALIFVLHMPVSAFADGEKPSYETEELDCFSVQVDSEWNKETTEVTENNSRITYTNDTFSVVMAIVTKESLEELNEAFDAEFPGYEDSEDYEVRLVCYACGLEYPDDSEAQADKVNVTKTDAEVKEYYFYVCDDEHEIKGCSYMYGESILLIAADTKEFDPVDEAALFRLFVTVDITAEETLEEEEEEIEETIDESRVTDFKSFCWGDSADLVEAFEGEPDLSGDMDTKAAFYYGYSDRSVAGLDALLAYYFCDEGLYKTRYILQEEHSSDQKYLDDFDTVISALTKKYGEPLLTGDVWDDDSRKDYYTEAEGIKYGHMYRYAYWITDTTIISAEISADNFDFSTTFDYSSLEIEPKDNDYLDDL